MMDERQKGSMNAAMAKVLVVVYIAVVMFGLMKFLVNFQITDCLFELSVAIGVPILVLLFMRGRKKANFPMSLAGLAISPDRTREAKLGRIKAYALDSLQFSLILTTFQAVWSMWQSVRESGMNKDVLSGAVKPICEGLGVYFAVFFVLNYIIYELKSRRYCREHGEDLT